MFAVDRAALSLARRVQLHAQSRVYPGPPQAGAQQPRACVRIESRLSGAVRRPLSSTPPAHVPLSSSTSVARCCTALLYSGGDISSDERGAQWSMARRSTRGCARSRTLVLPGTWSFRRSGTRVRASPNSTLYPEKISTKRVCCCLYLRAMNLPRPRLPSQCTNMLASCCILLLLCCLDCTATLASRPEVPSFAKRSASPPRKAATRSGRFRV